MSEALQSKQKPEQKFGPFAGGIAVNVWINEVQTDGGPRKIRSITISPRRYQDPADNQWKDSPSLRPIDLPALILGLQAAQQHITSNPLPDQLEDVLVEVHGSGALVRAGRRPPSSARSPARWRATGQGRTDGRSAGDGARALPAAVAAGEWGRAPPKNR